ncbi:TerC family protein [Neiella sp. HB171785]|uniref:TerC family protein n=2 Tax=Neiella litorisoli TaxID=2771431 RepID=A0A8J6UJL6_9GAMM|nr:TerC family protein [Neiella litorisoli]MBD1390813.1 TerC family protein [Neiella litorisoli]
MMEWMSSPEAWVALGTLTVLEVVLGIDNIIFISILCGRLPKAVRAKARYIGLSVALFARIALLLSITWVMGLTAPLVEIMGNAISGRDLILIGGGLFLLAKSTHEIHNSLEGDEDHQTSAVQATFGAVIIQIVLIDIVFSFDSVITAVGIAKHVPVMIIAMVIAVVVMMLAASSIAEFVERHPTVKMLALSFLVLLGFTLIAEGFELHIPKGYIYFAMAFSFGVEMLNLRMKKKRQKAVRLHNPRKAKLEAPE